MSDSRQIHASVLEFLINHGYMESAEAFRREAMRNLDVSAINTQVTEDQLIQDLANLQIQR